MNANEILQGMIGQQVFQIAELAAANDALSKTKLKAWDLLAQCIRSDQVPDAAKVLDADPDFAKWYRAKFAD